MPKCPKCSKEIKYLITDVKAWRTGVIYEPMEDKLHIDLNPAFNTYTFRCPQCHNWLFRTENQARKFLKQDFKPKRKVGKYNSQW